MTPSLTHLRHCLRGAAYPACRLWTQQWRPQSSSWQMRPRMHTSSTMANPPPRHQSLLRYLCNADALLHLSLDLMQTGSVKIAEVTMVLD